MSGAAFGPAALKKHGTSVTFPVEVYAHMLVQDGDERYARKEAGRIVTPPTEEQWATYREHELMFDVLCESPYFHLIDWMKNQPRDNVQIEYAETHDEWLARVRVLIAERFDS